MSIRKLSAVLVLSIATLLWGAGAAQAGTNALSQQDQAYLQGAHQGNLAEIAAGTLAQSKSQDQQVKDLGAMLIADHTKLDAAVRQVASATGTSLPSAPNAEQRAMQSQMQQAPAGEFDALFVTGQISGHAKTMRLGEQELSNGSDARVKTNARAAAPVIARHLDMFRAAAERQGLPESVQAGRTGVAEAPGQGIGTTPVVLVVGGLVLMALGGTLAARRVRA
jgi:putative membrane protein